MSSSGLRFDLACMSLCALSRTSQPEMLPSCSPIVGPNTVITQDFTSILLLVD